MWLKKKLLLILGLALIYGAYFLLHLPQQSSTPVLGATSNLILFEQPIATEAPLISAIASATKSIDVEVYLLSDKNIIASLLTSCQKGVTVRVLLEEHPFGGGTLNQQTQQALAATCVVVKWTNPSFALTHEKALVIDNKIGFILSQNLAASSFTKNREYDIEDVNPADVAELEAIFTADWQKTPLALPYRGNLVVSPVNARDALESLIAQAQKSIAIEMEALDDKRIVALLQEKAKQLSVALLVPDFSQMTANKKYVDELIAVGVQVKTIHSPYMHAKLVIIDSQKAYMGSVNLTTQSLDENREVGIILIQPDVIAQLKNDFSQDWEMSFIPHS